MRVFAIAQSERAWRANVEDRGQEIGGERGVARGRNLREACAHGAVIRSGGGERLLAPAANGFLSRENRLEVFSSSAMACVVGGRGDHGDVLPVLGRRADHRGSADVDVLDQLFERRVFLRGDLFEFVEIDADQIDGRDAVLGNGLHVLGLGAHGEDAAGNARVNGLHAAVEHLGKAGDLGHFAQGSDACFGKGFERASGGDDFDAESRKGAGEIDNARFVGDADESALDL